MSQASFNSLDLVPDAVIVVDEAMTLVQMNAAARRLGEGGTRVVDVFHVAPADAASVDDAVRSVLRGLVPRVDFDCATVHGEEIRRAWISVTPRPDGTSGAVIVHRDVTERARTAQEIDAARDRLQHLCDATAKAVCLHRGGVIIDANREMRKTFGLTTEELVGRRVDTLFKAVPGEELAAHIHRTDAHVFNATAMRSDGTSFLAELVSSPVDRGSDAMHGLSIRDVSAQRAAEHAFRESEERFRLIAELSSEGLVLTERGIIFHANTAITELFGYDRDEIIGMSAIDLTAPEDRDVAIAHIRSGSEEPYEAKGIRKDGTTFFGSIMGMPLPYQGRLVRGTRMRDITAQRHAEEVLRRNIVQEEKLRIQSERLAEMSTPFIPITDDIIAMPLIGTMDTDRANQALETMLEGIARTRAHTAIVDITGVSTVDTSVASSLVRLAQAVRLQGAQVVLTGIRPEMAQTLVKLDVNLTGIIVKGSFQDGIRYAMKRGKRSGMDGDS